MDGTVKVPGIKKPMPRWAVFGGLAVTGGGIIYYYRKNKAAPAGAATTTSQYPPDGTTGNPQDLYSTDPATGQTYGNEQGGQAGFGVGGGTGSDAYPWDGTYGNPSDPYSVDPGTGQTYGNEGGGGGTTGGGPGSGGPPFSTNQAWAAFAEQQLTSADPGSLAEALGLYLDGQPVSSAQKALIFQAEGVAGQVPVAGTGGYPPKIRSAPATKGPGHGTTEVVPGVKGKTGEEARDAIEKAHLKYAQSPVTTPKGRTAKVTSQSPAAGRRVAEHSTVHVKVSYSKPPARKK